MKHIVKYYLILFAFLLPVAAQAAIGTSVGSGSICPENEIAIPVTVSNCDGVGAISLVLNYDASKVSYLGYQNVNSNLSSNLIVNANGGKVYLTWYSINAVNIGSGTLLELRFQGIAGTSALSWETASCEYSDANGHAIQATYSNGSITVYETPSITSHPNNVTVTAGQNASFSVNASGQGLSYQWQERLAGARDWNNLSNGSPYSNVTTRQMTINGVTMAMRGNQYRCVVSGTCPSPVTSNAASLTVNQFIPTITTAVTSTTSCPNTDFVIPITVTNCNNIGAISLALTYDASRLTYIGFQNAHSQLNGEMHINAVDGVIYFTWASVNTVLNLGSSTLVEFQFSSEPGNSVFLWNSTDCEYSDPSGNAIPATFNPGSVTVYYAPHITSNPANRIIDEGSGTTFTVGAGGQGLSYQWQISQDGGATWNDLSNDSHYSNVTSNTLRVSNAILEMTGNKFRCAVSGTCEPAVVSESASLTVNVILQTIVTSISNVSSCPDMDFSTTISVTNFNNVGAISLALAYNNSILTYEGFEDANEAIAGENLFVNAVDGVVYISWMSLSGVSLGNAELISLKFSGVSGSSSLSWNTSQCEYSTTNGTRFPTSYQNGTATIFYSPYVNSHPSDRTIDQATNTTFSVNAGGQSLSYQWQVSEDEGETWIDLSNGSHYNNVTNNTLNVNNATLDMDGFRYRCRVTGQCEPEVFSKPALLRVRVVIPTIAASVGSLTTCSDVEFTIPVNVTNFNNVGAFSLALTYGESLTYSGYEGVNDGLSGGNLVVNAYGGAAYLTWYSVSGVDLGNTTLLLLKFTGTVGSSQLNWVRTQCEFSDRIGTTIPSSYQNGSVTINEVDFSITSHPIDRNLIVGENTTFAVETIGNNLTYQWQASENGGASWNNLSAGDHYANVRTSVLSVNDVILDMDEVMYRCAVTGTCGIQYSQTATLHLQSLNSYEITTSSSPADAGTTTGAGTYSEGATVTLTATGAKGYHFVYWDENGSVVSASATYTFVATSDRELTAHFELDIYHVTLSTNPSEAGTLTGTGDYIYGDIVTVSAVPNLGYSFVNWTEDGEIVSSESSFSFVAEADRSLVANFSRNSYSIAVSADPSSYGTVTGGGNYLFGTSVTVVATAGSAYMFENWTENGSIVSQNPTYTFSISGNRNLVAHFSMRSYVISAIVSPSGAGSVTGTGSFNYGETAYLHAIANENYIFINWTEDNVIVSSDADYSFSVTGDRTLTANFEAHLPELHVTSITHSDFVAGHPVTISWTVSNDGQSATPTGEVWYDRVWLSVENRVAAADNDPILLGEFQNLSALNVDESYTQTQSFNIPQTLSGVFYLFVITDAYDAHHIYWENDEVEIPYTPPPYIGSESAHCTGSNCGNGSGNRIYEMTEYEREGHSGGSYHDNFFYDLVTIEVPPLPDLQVTSIVPPTNFYSGTSVTVTATITNLGEDRTTTNRWTDALYVSDTSVFIPTRAICLGYSTHSGYLDPEESYQQTLSGTVPITMHGDAYFYVYTDVYGQVYEHVMNANNVSRSDMVNIILTPPADLVPYIDVCPQTASTGELFHYSYTVINQGAGHPNCNYWYDKVYLCQNSEHLDDNAILISECYHTGDLEPNAEYTVSQNIVLPNAVVSGNYYLYVVSDARNNVFEYLYEDNNTSVSANAISISQPDLQVMEIEAPDTLTACYPINLAYILGNTGLGAMSNWSVQDRIGIAQNSNLTNPQTITLQGNSISLQTGQTQSVYYNGVMPNVPQGNYYLFVETDIQHALNESDEANNVKSIYPIFVCHQPLPDLKPVSLTVPEIIQAGNVINISFDVANIGDVSLIDENCSLDIYAVNGNDRICCPMQAQTLPLGGPNVSIAAGDTVHFVRTIMIPATVTSNYSTFQLIADFEDRINELDENNNTISTSAIVNNCPLPDLMVTVVSLPETIQSGGYNTIEFDIANIGQTTFESNTLDFAVNAVLNDQRILCPLFQQQQPQNGDMIYIPVGGSFHVVQDIIVPPTVSVACRSFEITIDPHNSVMELNKSNNTASSLGTVNPYPFDLEMVSMTIPEEMIAGQTYTLSWTVENAGNCPSETIPMFINNNGGSILVPGLTLPTPWIDKLYISDDIIPDANDLVLVAIDRSTTLLPNNAYTVSQTFIMPYSAAGEKFAICIADDTNETYDQDRSNNVLHQSITTEIGLLPDLRITEFDADGVLTVGEPYWIRYTVVNEGEAATQSSTWTDAFYLGQYDDNLTNSIIIGSKIHNGELQVGESYTDSIVVTVPNNLEGNYYLLGFTDATSVLFEDENEDDNLASMLVELAKPLPCDLTVVDLDYPATVLSGDNITVSWYVNNIGTNAATGKIRDAAYLSSDATWSSDDVMIGYVESNVDIQAGTSLQRQLTGMVQGVPEGNYYVIVRTNILHALNEVTYDNNVTASLLTASVGYPILSIGESVERTLESNQYIYYRIDVGPEFAHQTLSCQLTTSSDMVANRLYLSHEGVPTLSAFDFGAATPYESELEVLVPSLNQGYYYMMVSGSSSDGQPQNITISTSIINFEILHVNEDHGSNAGSLTTQILGAKFDSIMDFRLVNNYLREPAEKVFFSNSTESFVTFDLTDLEAGVYGVEAELPGGIITIKDGAFTVEEGLPAELAVNIIAPSSVRRGNVFTISIEYGNIGSTDLNVSKLVVVSQNGDPIAFTAAELALNQTQISFETAEPNGNPDVLRPGVIATRSFLVRANSNSSIRISVFAIRNEY